MNANLQTLLSAKPHLFKLASIAKPSEFYISSGVSHFDSALGGGLPLGAISEWGVAPGQPGREVILQFINHIAPLTLWNYSEDLLVYPPLWGALGVNLSRIFFAQSKKPVQDLKAAFIDPLFRLLVLDCPEKLTANDFAFMAHYARRNKQSILVLRPRLLSQPNPFAKLRVNSSFDLKRQCFALQILRGAKPTAVMVAKQDFRHGG